MSSTLKVDILQDSGGNNIIASDGSGNLTTQKILHPAFQAYLATNTDLSDETFTVVPFETVQFDTDSLYNTSTYKYTPNVAGKYFVYSNILVDASNGFWYTQSDILKNDSNISGAARLASQYENTSATDDSMERMPHTVSGIVEMNGTTDTLSVNIYTSGGNPATIRGNTTFFGAYRIGD